MSYQAKRITIFVLVLLTITLVAFAFFIIQQIGTMPEDTPVGGRNVCPKFECVSRSTGRVTKTAQEDCNYTLGTCNSETGTREKSFCGNDIVRFLETKAQAEQRCLAPSGSNQCVVRNDGGVNGCILVEGNAQGQTQCVPSVNIYKFSRPMKGPNDDCFTSDNQFLQWQNAGPGRYCASDIVQSCECVQIDYRKPSGQDIGVKAGKWDATCTDCGSYCEGTGQSWCANGYTCQNNKCILNECAANPAACNADLCSVKVLKQCGAACTGTGQGDCQSSFVCSNNVCKLPTCATNPELCNADLCSTKAKCGEPGFVPGPGQCANPGTTTCDAQCRPISENVLCGQRCGEGRICSDGSVCDTTKNVCVIQQCVGRNDCVNNGCKLPESAIFNDERDYVIYGIMFMLLGFIAYKYALVQKIFSRGLRAIDFMTDRTGEKTKSNINKQRDSFEKKFRK